MHLNFECLYFLENTDLYILEIRKTTAPIDAEPAAKFRWLKIGKEKLDISPFTFAAMDSAGEIEERFFEEGYLKFNHTDGTFIEKYNSAQHPLSNRQEWIMPTSLSNALVDFVDTKM